MCKKIMLNRGNTFIETLNQARGKIVKSASKFIHDGSVRFNSDRQKVFFYCVSFYSVF